jgi:pimeloyl-ACP methyl ester carboxylesterase
MDLELVSVTTGDGVRLDGTLARPDPGIEPGNVDAVVLHHGYGAKFYGPSFFGSIQEALASSGIAALRVNNRGHDLVYDSPAGRLGASCEMMDDCRLDWKAWLDFTESLGYRRTVLWGHSLGAVKTAYFLAVERDGRVSGAIISSPPRFSYSQSITMERGVAWRDAVTRAQELVDAGRGSELMQVSEPLNSLMTASTFADKYGPAETYNVLTLLPRVEVPVLVTLGALEGLGPQNADWTAFGGLAGQLTQVAASHDSIEFEHVEGANRAYAGKADELRAIARAWLQRLKAAAPAGQASA